MDSEKLFKNALITIQVACGVKAGETVLLITERYSRAPYNDDLAPVTEMLAEACVRIGALPVVLNIDKYIRTGLFLQGHQSLVIKNAMENADVVLNMVDYIHFSRFMGLGTNEEGAWQSDMYVTGEQRMFALQSHGMDKWNITPEQIAMISARSRWLADLIRHSRQLTVTSALGTDFRCSLGEGSNVMPYLCLVPLFGETPVIPCHGTEEGVLIVDGPTQQGVRPLNELHRENLRITVEKGIVTEYSGDPVQVKRLEAFMNSGNPRAEHVDEVGILTTDVPENNLYWWADGTHHYRRVHIAIGNNILRGRNVHGQAHMDCEISLPTVSVDGMVIIKDGVFLDEKRLNL